jgi:hypothetical protein
MEAGACLRFILPLMRLILGSPWEGRKFGLLVNGTFITYNNTI